MARKTLALSLEVIDDFSPVRARTISPSRFSLPSVTGLRSPSCQNLVRHRSVGAIPSGPSFHGYQAHGRLMQPGRQHYQVPFDVAYKKVATKRNLRKLEQLFYEADRDGSGEMTLDEFNEALRIPRMQRAFSNLGVQPHQSEMVFKSLDKSRKGQLGIEEFMIGLTDIIRKLGVNPDGSSKELDLVQLSASYVASQRLPLASSLRPSSANLPLSPTNSGTGAGLSMGPVHLLPAVKVQRAFVNSASAKALHPATAIKRPILAVS